MIGRMRSAILLLVGACAPSGLVLEVGVKSGVERVELFVGDAYCADIDCPTSVLVPDVGMRAVTSAYLMTDEQPWTRDKDELIDGYAGFQLQATKDTTLGILVAVGYDAAGRPIASEMFRDVKLTPATDERWRVTLHPTTELTPIINPMLPAAHTIKRWQGPSQTRASCLLFEHWGDAGEADRYLVVPRGDRDCDEVPADRECAPWTNNANGAPPTIQDARCVTPKTIDARDVCVLGGPQCYENGMSGAACVALDTDYCAPTALCGCAGMTGLECLRTKLDDGVTFSAMPNLKCVIGLDANGVPCSGGGKYPIDASSFVGSSTTACKDMRMSPLALPLPSLDRSLALAANDQAYLLIENTSPMDCTADLTWHGTAVAGIHHGVFDLVLGNGKHLAIPMRVELASTCSGESKCAFSVGNNMSDAMFGCVAPPDATPLICPPDPSMNCSSGVFCSSGLGGQCCRQGERCGQNGCECGTLGYRCNFSTERCTNKANDTETSCGTECCPVSQCPY